MSVPVLTLNTPESVTVRKYVGSTKYYSPSSMDMPSHLFLFLFCLAFLYLRSCFSFHTLFPSHLPWPFLQFYTFTFSPLLCDSPYLLASCVNFLPLSSQTFSSRFGLPSGTAIISLTKVQLNSPRPLPSQSPNPYPFPSLVLSSGHCCQGQL